MVWTTKLGFPVCYSIRFVHQNLSDWETFVSFAAFFRNRVTTLKASTLAILGWRADVRGYDMTNAPDRQALTLLLNHWAHLTLARDGTTP